MPASIEDLMTANLLEVFGERDPERRRAAIERTYAEDVAFLDPDGETTGWDALDAKAQGILDGAPGFAFAPRGPIHVNHDLGYLAWGLGPEGAEPVVEGFDVALVADGVIVRLYTVLTRG